MEYSKQSTSSPINTTSCEGHNVVPVLPAIDAKDSLSENVDVIDSCSNNLDKSITSGTY